MKTKLFFTIALSFLVSGVNAQLKFQKKYTNGGITLGYMVKQTNDGGYIISGTSENIGAGVRDVYLIKTDAAGDTLWTRSYGGTSYDEGFSVEQTIDSGYIITGYTNSFSTSSEKVYLIKTNSTGDTLWTKTYGGNLNGTGYSVKQTSDNGYIITGGQVDINGTHNVLMIKTNVTGDTLWTKTFGGGGDDRGFSVTEAIGGGYVVAGNYSTGGIYLVKTNLIGDTLWTKGYIVEGPPHINTGYSIQQTADLGYIVAGIAYGASGVEGVALKTDVNGNFVWSKTYSGLSHVYINYGQQTTDGGYIFAGWSQSFPVGSYKSLLIKTDATGDTLWTKQYDGAGSIYNFNVQQTTDGGFVLVTADNFNIFLTKTDSLGNSGCDQGAAWPVVTSITPVITTPLPLFASGGIVNAPATQIARGGTIITLCINVGISEFSASGNSISIFPNPAEDNFMVSINAELINVQVEIFNVFGEKVYSAQLKSLQETINAKQFSSGIYFVKVSNGQNQYTKKLIIEQD